MIPLKKTLFFIFCWVSFSACALDGLCPAPTAPSCIINRDISWLMMPCGEKLDAVPLPDWQNSHNS